MKVIIAGSRDIHRHVTWLDRHIVESRFDVTHVLEGGARGIDRLGREWAKQMNVPFTTYKADWSSYGRSAGLRRNAVMAMNADALIAIWDGKSNGTRNMIELMERQGKPVHVVRIDN